MEARDSRSKIRPLPVDEIEGGLPQSRPEPVKKAVPLIGVALGALAFTVIALGLGPTLETEVASGTTTTVLAAQPAVEPTTSTTTTVPPLRELLPFIAEPLRLVEFTTSSARIATWDPAAPAPTITATVNSPRLAGFNADGTRVMIHSFVRTGSAVIDDTNGGRPVYLNNTVSSVLWHPTDPAQIAWTEGELTDPTVLSTASVTGLESHGIVTPALRVELDPALRLVAWGPWGFLLERADGVPIPEGNLLLLDPAGNERSRLTGDFYDSSDDGLLLLARVDESGVAMPFVVEQSDLTETTLTGLDIGAADFLLSRSGEWVIAVTPQADGHTSVLARTVWASSTRLSSVRNPTAVVGLVWDDRYVALQDVATGDLIFKDWNTGAEFHLSLPDATEIAAIFF